MNDLASIEPEFTPSQREELDRVDYLMAELRSLNERGLIGEEAIAAVEAEKAPRLDEILHLGMAAGAMKTARACVSSRPADALILAEKARVLAPGQIDAWAFSASLLARLGRHDEAIELMKRGIEEHGLDALRPRLRELQVDLGRKGRSEVIDSALARAREAFASGDFDSALTATREVFAREPRHPEALAIAVQSLMGLGRWDDAVRACSVLRQVAPTEATTLAVRIRDLRAGHDPSPEIEPASAPKVLAVPIPAGPPWSAIAAEFLEDHWQKLFLALAVLLTAVGSTVGAAVVLGDRLQMAEGKCLLATAYTLMFAALGRGMAKWGAERVGRIMRLTTLIVLPVSFALVGELPGLGRSSPTSMAVLVIDSVAMMALIWLICRSLGLPGGRVIPLALIAFGMANALTTRTVSMPVGLAVLLVAGCVYAAASEWLGAWLERNREADDASEGDSPYFAFGLLTLFFACAVGRIGGYVLGLPLTLYALPTMLAAAATVRIAGGLSVTRHAGRSVAILRLAGYSVSALAFAIALARPSESNPLFSGNTLATAVIGLALYGRALSRERKPAYLYAAFAAMFLAYFGARIFVRDLTSTVEGSIGLFLGYGRKLPLPFRGLHGLVFNTFLAALSIVFKRRWKDERLAMHCHYIGLPLAVGACVLSSFEPLAGVLVMGGYAIGFALATWVFATPALEYLACLAITGSAVAASTYLGDLAAGARSLAIASVGVVLWGACRILERLKVHPTYRSPIVQSARVVAAIALVFAAWAALPWGPPTWTTISAVWVVCGLYILIGRETPHRSLAYAAVGCSAVGSILSIQLLTARWGRPIDSVWLAAWSCGIALLYQFLSPLLAELADRRGPGVGRVSRTRPYPLPLIHVGLILQGFAVAILARFLMGHLGAISTGELAGISVAMSLASLGLWLSSLRLRDEGALRYASVITGACGAVAASLAVALVWGYPATFGRLAVACGGVSLILVGLGDRIRGRTFGIFSAYRAPMLDTSWLAVVFAWIFGGLAWAHTGEFTVALTLTALALAFAIRQRPEKLLAIVALTAGLVAWLVGWGVLLRWELPRNGQLILTYAVLALATTDVLRWLTGRRGRGIVASTLARGLPEFAGVSAAIALWMVIRIFARERFGHLTIDLALAALIFLWLPRFRREAGTIQLGLGLASLATLSATRWGIGPRPPELVFGALALTASIDGLILVALRWIGRKRGASVDLLDPLRQMGIVLAIASFGMAVFASAISLDSYAMAVSALMLVVIALVIAAVLDRSRWRTYAAIFTGVVAAYMTLFELGRGRTGHVSSLGVLASLLALTCWAIERLTHRYLRDEWTPIFRWPARDATIALATLAVLPEWNSPRALLFASVPFLLLIKSVPRPGWLYPALGLMVASVAFAISPRWGEHGLMTASVILGFAGWGIGWAVWRFTPSICRTLRLPEGLRLEYPIYHVSMLLGVAALSLGGHTPTGPGLYLSSPWWVLASVGVLSLLMLKPYPLRGWVDGFVGLMSLAVWAGVAPSFVHPMTCGLILLSLSLGWRMAEWVAIPTQSRAARRMGVGFDAFAGVFGQWALGLLAVGSLPLIVRTVASVADASLGIANSLPFTTNLEWWTGLVAILLLGANLDLARRSSRFEGTIGLHITATMFLWWLSIPASPLMVRLRLDPSMVLPLVTIAQAVISVAVGVRARSLSLARFAGGLSLVAIALTSLRPSIATTITLFLASAVQGSLCVAFKRKERAGLGSFLWLAALAYASWNVTDRLDWESSTRAATLFAVGQALGAIGLVWAGRVDRFRGIGMAPVVEGFGRLGLLLATIGALVPSFVAFGSVGQIQALANVGVMFAVGSMCAVLASRCGSIRMAFAAQASILIGYIAFRTGFELPPGGDSTAMLLLAGIDLGIAEIAGRGRGRLFALPAMVTGLILPLISVGLALRHGLVRDESLFILFAAGTFYAATCGRMRWKSLGYASAVLYNAALWVLWSRFGWKLASDPQFFLVPVGFSTILFAEANRRELGRSGVNAVRGAGLSLIYLSLAVPIWQTASFAAWAAILGFSLLGIFAGIALRSQTFLWLGLSGFVLDVVYQLGRIGMEHAAAKWAIMCGLGLALFGFVALNEKKKLMATIRKYVDVVRAWD